MIDAKSSVPPPLRDLVLIGGGHSHVQVIKRISMKQIPGVRVTLISEDYESAYSGMLPGCVASIYTKDQISIQLSALCSSANVRFICAEVTELDPNAKQISLRGRSPVRYDTLSINAGGSPGTNRSIGINVKPINLFLPRWQAAAAEIGSQKGKRSTLCIVGAGAGGVELAFAMRASLPPETKIKLFGPKLLPGHGDLVERRVMKVLIEKKIDLIEKYFETDSDYQDGNEHVFWVTGTESPEWIKDSGLCTDDRGFVKVNKYLQSLSHSNVFAAGDVAHLTDQERDKAGVYAVRAGPYLFRNLSKAAQGIPPQFWSRYQAQEKHLILLGCGDGTAIAIRNGLAVRGRIFWRLKNWIDKAFIRKFNELPKMGADVKHSRFPLADEMPDMDMRCGGCGAKIAAEPLRRVLDRLPKQLNINVRLGVGDDAAIIKHSRGESLISVDGFRSMVDDVYKFGRITAHHSLNDLFAMGGRPTGALAFVTLPVMSPELIEEDLFQLLSGVSSVLTEHQASLVGGHSAEGADLSLALTVVGEPVEASLVKSGSVVNDQFILTKPLGTGVLLAGAMRGEVNGMNLKSCLSAMDQSNAAAAKIFVESGATSMTDVTGFGFLGHLWEMVRGSQFGVRLNISAIPIFEGVIELIAGGITSSLQESNESVLQEFAVDSQVDATKLKALVDPQTSGGLLASVPENLAPDCLRKLQGAGYAASIVGNVIDSAERAVEP